MLFAVEMALTAIVKAGESATGSAARLKRSGATDYNNCTPRVKSAVHQSVLLVPRVDARRDCARQYATIPDRARLGLTVHPLDV
jgi:hypothetical protein